MDQTFTKLAGKIAAWVGQPLAFMLAFATVVAWAITGPLFHYSDVWQLVINTGTTIITFLMVFLVQNTQNRDASAMQAKLDELIRAVEDARGEFIGIEHLTDKEIEGIRTALERTHGAGDDKPPSRDAVNRLLSRR